MIRAYIPVLDKAVQLRFLRNPCKPSNIYAFVRNIRQFHASLPGSVFLPIVPAIPVILPAIYFGRKYLLYQEGKKNASEQGIWRRLQQERLNDSTQPHNLVLSIGQTRFSTVTGSIGTLRYFDCASMQALGRSSDSFNSHEASSLVRNELESLKKQNPTGRLIVTVPSKLDSALSCQKIIREMICASTDVVFVPDAVAAIWGLQATGNLPIPHAAPTLVINIGNQSTSISIVKEDQILAATLLPNLGGDLIENTKSEQHAETEILQVVLPTLYKGIHLSGDMDKPNCVESLWASSVTHLVDTVNVSPDTAAVLTRRNFQGQHVALVPLFNALSKLIPKEKLITTEDTDRSAWNLVAMGALSFPSNHAYELNSNSGCLSYKDTMQY